LQTEHPSRPHQRKRAQESAAADAARFPLRFDRPQLVEFECASRERDRAFADQDLACIGRLFRGAP
jgi:hypothetical protein